MVKPGPDSRYIDIAKVIAESDTPVLKRLPGFLVRWIETIIRQDEMNRILSKYADDSGADFLVKIIAELNLKLEIEGKENLPENGKCIFVANHPFGVIDGLVLTRVVTEKYGTLKAIANDVFMFLPQLHPLIAAVNVFDSSSREYVQALNETYEQEIPITHFPAGEVSRFHKGRVQDPDWQKSFIPKAISSKRDIVPLYFYGRNSHLFYTVHFVRRIFGISLNIELLLLPREMFRKRNKTIRVRIGQPISWQLFDGTATHREWARKVRALTYGLGNRNP
jgi:putative hemolysin